MQTSGFAELRDFDAPQEPSRATPLRVRPAGMLGAWIARRAEQGVSMMAAPVTAQAAVFGPDATHPEVAHLVRCHWGMNS